VTLLAALLVLLGPYDLDAPKSADVAA
jgi:hypothetical protein